MNCILPYYSEKFAYHVEENEENCAEDAEIKEPSFDTFDKLPMEVSFGLK